MPAHPLRGARSRTTVVRFLKRRFAPCFSRFAPRASR
jgi:hypothetical protein